MISRKPGAALSLLGLLLTTAASGLAATPGLLSGALTGSVKDGAGNPEMGATVLLYNRYDKLIQKSFTNGNGDFAFDVLIPDVYSIRVTLASFVPALKKNIVIQPGMRSILAINLASVLSSIELVSTGPSSSPLMSDDWKWVLRGGLATRPVLRAFPEEEQESSSRGPGMFSETSGLLKVSSGESNPFDQSNNTPELGTSFGVATLLYGNTKLQLSGNFGYALSSAMPTAGFRTTVSRGDTLPELKVTVQQVSLPAHGFLASGQDNAPVLRTLSLTTMDRLQLFDNIDLEYGTSLQSVSFIDRVSFMSPFAKLNYRLGSRGVISAAYSSGTEPIDLYEAGTSETLADPLEQEVSALGMLPRVSMRGGDSRVQRTTSAEIGYSVTRGSRTFGAAIYKENISNQALTMMAPDGLYDSSDLLPEISSNSSVFNVGNFGRSGYMAYITQNVDDHLNITVAYGRGGALRTDRQELTSDDPNELRSSIHTSDQQWVEGKIAMVLPVLGTHVTSSYDWMDSRALTPNHVYLTQQFYAEPGLNIRVRQPIPMMHGMPGRLEATAEMRNLLAQGYLGMSTSDGRRVILTNSPRALRGGLSFIF